MTLSRPSLSLVVASLALCLATGGVGYAAGSLPHHSVGSSQLKKNSVAAKNIKKGAVTGAKVRGDSLTGAQIDEDTLVLPRRPGTAVLAADAFAPLDSAYTYSLPLAGGLSATASGLSQFEASVQLPPGARVTAVKVFVGHLGGSTISVFVGRSSPAGFGAAFPSGADSSPAQGDQTITVTPTFTADPSSALSVMVALPQGVIYKLYGAEVDYL